jgi:hypothetical protein
MHSWWTELNVWLHYQVWRVTQEWTREMLLSVNCDTTQNSNFYVTYAVESKW